MSELLTEAIEALAEAAESERGIRFGADVVRELHAALLDATNKPHTHAWQPLGWDRPASTEEAHVIQSCVCGEARAVVIR